MNNSTWILVADSSKARIFSTHKASLFNGDGKKLKLVSEHEHPESRKKDIDLISDRQGKFGSGTFVEATDPKHHQEELFAVELTKTLTKGHGENRFQELICIAPAAFMGLLNKHMSHEVAKNANLKIEKDYTTFTEQELVKHLQDYL